MAAHTGISAAARGVIIDTTRHSPSWFAKGSSKITHNVFVADTLNNAVEIFDFKTRTQTGQIGGLSAPEGLATDTAGNLYESNTTTQTIQIYAAPYSGNPTILQDPGMYPVGLHVDGSGNVWVANICSGSGGSCVGAGGVVEYKGGKGKPIALNGGPARSYFVTTDAKGNVWADGQDSSGSPIIGYFANGKGAFKPVSISFLFPGGIQFDKSGNLLLDDQEGNTSVGGSEIFIYPPGSTTPSGSVTVQTTGDDVVSFALGSVQLRLFAPLYLAGSTNVVVYPSGALSFVLNPTTVGNPDAVAVTPATLP
ncbi:MAG: hypothetical protein M3R51_06235 [Candidatus Eremiobacteraeota bacterium]|nr:hypothetical protein [Candidatus Eremiobacteraeota bacterium]